VSCKEISKEELERIIPVTPPKVNKKINPSLQIKLGVNFTSPPSIEVIHEKILIPVGIAITIVALVK